MRFADGLNEAYERKKRVNDGFMAFNLSNQKTEFLFTELGSLAVEQSSIFVLDTVSLRCLLDLVVEMLSRQFSGVQWSNALQKRRFKGSSHSLQLLVGKHSKCSHKHVYQKLWQETGSPESQFISSLYHVITVFLTFLITMQLQRLKIILHANTQHSSRYTESIQ